MERVFCALDRIYIFSTAEGEISSYDLATGALLATIPLSCGTLGITRDQELIVFGGSRNTVSILDPISLRVLRTRDLPTRPRTGNRSVSPGGTMIVRKVEQYVVLDCISDDRHLTITLDNPFCNFAISRDDGILVVRHSTGFYISDIIPGPLFLPSVIVPLLTVEFKEEKESPLAIYPDGLSVIMGAHRWTLQIPTVIRQLLN